jgi:DNA-binding NarL/FixJ family response regulator
MAVLVMSLNAVLITDPLGALRKYAAEIVGGINPDALCYEACDGQTAVELAALHSPDLIIMEVAMPGMNGIEAAARIWATQPDIKILFWTQNHRDIYLRELKLVTTDESIYGYVLKDAAEDKLSYAISSICLHHNPYIDGAIRRQMLAKHNGTKLNEREFEVLQDMALGLTEKAIARRRKLTIRGVQSRAASIYSKLLPEKSRAGSVDSRIDEMFSRRSLLLCEAVRNGLIEPDSLTAWKMDLDQWLLMEAKNFNGGR